MIRVTGTRTVGGRANPPTVPRIVLKRRTQGQKYWQEQRWRFTGTQLKGYYRTHYQSFKGVIDLFDSGRHRYHVHRPPPQLRQHPHWICFRLKGNGLYWVHFATIPQDVDAGIVAIERILHESLERYQAQS